MKKDFIYIFVIVVLGVVLFQSTCNNISNKKLSEQNIEALNDRVEYYVNELGYEVAEKKALQGSKKELLSIIDSKAKENEQLIIAIEGFKNTTTATKIITETRIDTFEILLTDTVPIEFSIPFEKYSKHFTISGVISPSTIVFNKIVIPNEQSIVIGNKRLGLFKEEYRAEVTNSNPLIRVKEIESYNFKVPRKRFGIGIVGGYGFNTNLDNGLFIGVGLSYNILSF